MENSFDKNPKESAVNREKELIRDMAEAAVSFAARMLGDLLIQKVVFVRGVEEKVEWLKGELERMQRFLRDAAEKQARGEAVGKWISDIRDVALDAEDVIDNFILKVDDPRRSRGLLENCGCFLIQVYRLYCLGQQIKSIERRMIELDASRQRLGIQSVYEETSSSRRSNHVEWRRQVPSWQADEHVVGLEKDVQTLLQNFVLGKKEGLSVASISGMGGIGKSTLARKVYNDAAVAERFDRRAWVCVSQDFRPKELMTELLVQLQQPGDDKLEVLEIMEKTTEEDRQRMVHERLQGRRYFIVVDDVWRPDDWEHLAMLFPDEGDKASRILVTSRDTTIPMGREYVHEMKGLDEYKSWQLFIKVAFGDSNGGNCPPQMEDIAEEILKKCKGLPLAIIVMGGLLLEQRQSDRGWATVSNRMNSYMTRNENNSVSAVLELSYHDLPPHLKSCFLCLSFFREDVPIRATKLVQIWIAQGFVPREAGEETMEEKARSYLDELINRNLVQVQDLSKKARRVKICQVHDLLRDLSIKKAKEEIKFEMLREGNNSEASNKFRHCAVYRNNESIRNPHLRTLFYFKSDSVLSNNWKSFGLLRILDMEGLGLEILPESIGSLIGLRYLGLRENRIEKLPRSLGQLKNLQVLDLRGNDNIIEVPNVIYKLYSVRHLYMPLSIICRERLKLDTLKNLQTLSVIHTSDIMVEHLSQLASLRKLEIRFSEGDFFDHGWDWLTSLQDLVQLCVRGDVGELPSARMFPPNLACLTLDSTSLQEDPMPVLEKLPKLAYLELRNDVYDGVEMKISHDGFPSLRALCLFRLDSQTSMIVGNGGMPDLERLDIRHCSSLEILPEGEELRLMSNLQELEIWFPSPECASKLESEEYSSIISNIPSVEIIPRIKIKPRPSHIY